MREVLSLIPSLMKENEEEREREGQGGSKGAIGQTDTCCGKSGVWSGSDEVRGRDARCEV